jgi:hypothetical protein
MQIQRDGSGRLTLDRGPFARRLVLTEDQASNLQPLLDAYSIHDRRMRRWVVPGVILGFALGGAGSNMGPRFNVVNVAGFTLLAAMAVAAFVIQAQFARSPLSRALADLHRTAPRA